MVNWFRRPISKDVSDKLQFLLSSQYWKLEQIREYQWDKLQPLIRHAFSKVPYYRSLFKQYDLRMRDIQSFDDFSKIPLLTKRDMQQSLDQMVAEGTDTSCLPLNSTGGSTGMPLNFYQDDSYIQWADAARLRAWKYMMGATDHDLEAVFWGATRDIGTGITLRKMIYHVFRDGIIPLNTFDLDEKMLNKYLRYYNLLKPRILRGYATSLYYVARYVESKGISISKPRAIISSTEVLHARMRETIERIFACKVFDSYGCREVSQVATECEAHNGLHMVFENQYVELDGQDILVTNLNNYIMPFIRYKIGDLASAIDYYPCSCGRFSPRIMSLAGRDNDNIELPNGKVINGEYFEFLFFGMSSIIQYQVIYFRNTDKLIVRLHVADSFNDVGALVKKTMQEKFNYENVAIEYTDVFDKTQAGKLRFVYMVD